MVQIGPDFRLSYGKFAMDHEKHYINSLRPLLFELWRKNTSLTWVSPGRPSSSLIAQLQLYGHIRLNWGRNGSPGRCRIMHFVAELRPPQAHFLWEWCPMVPSQHRPGLKVVRLKKNEAAGNSDPISGRLKKLISRNPTRQTRTAAGQGLCGEKL